MKKKKKVDNPQISNGSKWSEVNSLSQRHGR